MSVFGASIGLMSIIFAWHCTRLRGIQCSGHLILAMDGARHSAFGVLTFNCGCLMI